MNKKILIGKFGKPYGVKGWIKLISYTTISKKILQYFPWYLISIKKKYVKSDIKMQQNYKKKIIILLKNIHNRTEIEFLNNQKIFINEKILPTLKYNQYYWKDLLNCQVYNNMNINIGIVTKILNNTIHDILVIKKIFKNSSKKTILIPFIYPNYIKSVDILKKNIIINPVL
ncbi:ribosome maturation factor RimM [Buchnera aphidicola]|uniref:ribosome maturation factor RimM n=1 Tax=Buchnera aphidicola TaxID=9 RepID=UPI0031B674B8